jgi:hypothetical protein
MIKKYVLIFILFSIPFILPAQENDKQFQINDKSTFYYPGGIYSNFVISWYTKHLKAMKEPSLWADSNKPEWQSYRFLWLRTFHHPIAIRLNVKNDGTGELISKVTSGAGGYEPGELIIDRTTSLSPSQVSIFLKALDKADFWNMPSKGGKMGNDGAQWIIEGVKNEKYHLVDRWSPKNNTFRDAAIALTRLSNLKDNEIGDKY